jgi:uncharacterized membrane protein
MQKVSIQNRLKSKVFWVGILSIIALVGKTFGWYEIPAGWEDTVANVIFTVLGLFGVANNPSLPDKF